jgi:hypothetical protein
VTIKEDSKYLFDMMERTRMASYVTGSAGMFVMVGEHGPADPLPVFCHDDLALKRTLDGFTLLNDHVTSKKIEGMGLHSGSMTNQLVRSIDSINLMQQGIRGAMNAFTQALADIEQTLDPKPRPTKSRTFCTLNPSTPPNTRAALLESASTMFYTSHTAL